MGTDLVESDRSLSKVFLIIYILIEQFEFLKMDEGENAFFFTSVEYFMDQSLMMIMQECNKKSEINQQKKTLLDMILDTTQFSLLRDREQMAR